MTIQLSQPPLINDKKDFISFNTWINNLFRWSQELDQSFDEDQYLLRKGTRTLLGNWNAGDFDIHAKTFTSDVDIGTIPLNITSTTMCPNLNAELWSGNKFADFLNQAVKSTSSPTFENITDSGLTASTFIYSNASKVITSLANSAGYLKNDGSGGFSYDAFTSPQFTTIELGHASDTTLSRVSAGVVAIEGKNIYLAGGTDIAVADGGTNLSTIAAGSTLAANTLDTLSAITSTSGLKVLQNSAGTISWASTTGTGNSVFATTPTLTTPQMATINDNYSSDVDFFKNLSIGAGSDGKRLNIYRNSNQLTFFIDQYSTSIIYSNGSFIFQPGGSSYGCAVWYNFWVGWPYDLGAGNNNPNFQHYGLIGAAIQSMTWQVNDTSDWFELRRSNTAILGFDVQLPLKCDTLYADSDSGGLASTTGLTNATNSTVTNAYVVKGGQAASTVNTGWIKMYVGTNAVWVPYWQNATP